MHPIAIDFGRFSLHWYGILVALGFLAGLWTAGRRAPLDGVAPEKIHDLIPWLILGAIAGARTLYVITFWSKEFASQPFYEVFMVQKGGLVYYGGLVGASIAFLIYAWLRDVPVWKGADILAPSIALGYAFGRIGCLMNGCCYGRECDMPWAIHFPSTHSTYPHGVHPTQLYESGLSLLLYAGLAWLYRRKKFDGQIFAAYLVCYAPLRSFVELFRGDYDITQRFVGGVLTPAQVVSIAILASGLLLLILLPRHPVRTS
jgi:phosphatidylglycerol:prolipoprotein diacylglycerol transferase